MTRGYNAGSSLDLARRIEKDVQYAHWVWGSRNPAGHARLRLSSYLNGLLVDLARSGGNETRSDVLSVFHGMRVVVDPRLVGYVIEEDPDLGREKDLGWMSAWDAVPWVVGECQRLGHRPAEVDLDPTGNGLHTEVRCEICHYVFHRESVD